MYKDSIWAVIALTAITGTAAAAGVSMASGSGQHFAFGHPGPGAGPVQVIHVRVLDTLRFQPARIVVSRGETVEFIVTNPGKLMHEFVIGDAAVQAEHEKEMHAMPGMTMEHDVNGVTLPPGKTRDLLWTFTRDGVVEYACHEPGHFAAGMVGKIYIEPPGRHG